MTKVLVYADVGGERFGIGQDEDGVYAISWCCGEKLNQYQEIYTCLACERVYPGKFLDPDSKTGFWMTSIPSDHLLPGVDITKWASAWLDQEVTAVITG